MRKFIRSLAHASGYDSPSQPERVSEGQHSLSRFGASHGSPATEPWLTPKRLVGGAQRRLSVVLLLTLVLTIFTPSVAHASAGGTIVKAIARYLAKETGETVSEQAIKKMTREVGEELIERTARKVIREGGEESLAQMSELVAKHGPEVIRALDNAPDALPVLKLLDELPADDVFQVASRLAAGARGRELATLGETLGTSVLRAEAKHPGVGIAFGRSLGQDGAELSLKLTSDQAKQIGKHVADIGKLPVGQQKQLMALIENNSDRFASFVGRFVENNPGTVLFTAAGTTIVLANAERILGGEEVVVDADGNPTLVTKPGLIDRMGEKGKDIVKEPIAQTFTTLNWLLLLSGLVAIVLGAAVAYSKFRIRWYADRQMEANHKSHNPPRERGTSTSDTDTHHE